MIHELVSREIIEGVFIGDLLEFDESGVESIELVDFNLDSSLVYLGQVSERITRMFLETF
jgi:hypothetical protein